MATPELGIGSEPTPTERWRQARDVFEAALELDNEERARFLDLRCGRDSALRREVDELIAADLSAEDWSGPAGAVSGLLGEAMGDPRVGQLVGPYRLIEKVGAGGMGIVFRAERNDGQYRHRVAIKLLPGFADQRAIRRFRVERQVLASLEHPLIARLYDGGLAAGRPYLVMEYVEGEPITAYCDRHRLGLRERVAMVERLADALRHAHSRLVIHRDIKPHNILVDLEGTPRILDFGIAKVLTPEGQAPTLLQAQESDVILRPGADAMTPSYASPEQLRGLPVGTASDVYSLGLLLFELASGRNPFRGRERPPADTPPPSVVEVFTGESESTATETDAMEAIARQRGTRPSKLRRQLSGDLESILAKAMAPDPEKRYTTMDQLGADLGRFLADQPIHARRPSPAYRLRKLVHRHRFATLALTLAVLSLFTLVASLWVQGHKVARQRDLARLEKARADTSTAWLADLFGLAQPASRAGRPFTPLEMLRQGAERAREELGADTATRARVLSIIADAHRNLGQLDEADTLATEALRLRRPTPWPADLDRASPEERSKVAAWAESLHQTSVLERLRGRFHVAERSSRHALDLQIRILGERHEAVAASLDALAEALHELGRYEEADPPYRRALALRRQLLGEDHPLVAESLDHLALLELNRGRVSEALGLYRRALQLRRSILPESHPDLARSYYRLGSAQIDDGPLAIAEDHLRRALDGFRLAYGEAHPEFATCLHDLGFLQAEAERFDEAAVSLARALELRRQIYLDPHPELVQSLGMLASVSIERGELDRAELGLVEALSIATQIFGEHHPYTARTLAHHVSLWVARDQMPRALETQKRVIRILEKVLPADHPDLCEASKVLGSLQEAVSDPQARTSYEQAASCYEMASGPDHPSTIRARELANSARSGP